MIQWWVLGHIIRFHLRKHLCHENLLLQINGLLKSIKSTTNFKNSDAVTYWQLDGLDVLTHSTASQFLLTICMHSAHCRTSHALDWNQDMNYFIWHHTGDKQETPKTMKGKNELSEARLSSSCSNSLVYMFLQNRMVCVFFPEVYTSVGWDIVNNCWF